MWAWAWMSLSSYKCIISCHSVCTLMQAAIGNVFRDVLVHQIVKELLGGFCSGTDQGAWLSLCACMVCWQLHQYFLQTVEKADQNEGLGVHGQNGQGHFSDPSLELQI